MANLACLELHPHPVRADALDHPDELRVDLDPVPGVGMAAESARSRALSGRQSATRPRRLAEDLGLARHSRQHPHRASAGRSRRSAALPSRSRAKSSGARHRSPPASGGRKSVTACSSTTTRTPRTAPWPPPIRCAPSPTRGCRRRSRGTRSTTAIRRTSPSPRCRRASPTSAIAMRGSTSIPAPSRRCSSSPIGRAKEGHGDAPWPPHYKKQEGEGPRVQPSKGAATPQSASVTGRRASKHPLIEIGRWPEEGGRACRFGAMEGEISRRRRALAARRRVDGCHARAVVRLVAYPRQLAARPMTFTTRDRAIRT